MLFCLTAGLAKNQHKLFLFYAENCPNGIGHGKKSGFAGTAESNHKKIFNIFVFRQAKNFFLERSGFIFNIMSKVEVKEI
ncbi:hypothetical protein A2456_02280 [Candidatus Nomurabacteria bacterium RIFOXYC2_FULL_36_19]|uniref:Uncharacterized protein n=1 Tax=Candidatus Nomurabacteria bacterium RIFOXYC2_FULL_36_19 TaxID=1801806 RepID=A0A1F6YWP6_9BACT|nr:MAG: hypothetical protein A2456_02280 [Candidatus Nomurabacteria bacterium RIFOXYC2_FULL_36_19]OGJ13618.1 MAG: hypothetical protein A2554_03735 [Candidatus Nomurabacteria bacterium RIFOXYD2_FULL_35_12]